MIPTQTPSNIPASMSKIKKEEKKALGSIAMLTILNRNNYCLEVSLFYIISNLQLEFYLFYCFLSPSQ